MKHKLHAIAGTTALLTILTFWVSTLISELFGSHAQITSVKTFVLYGMILLIPAMIATGASGASLGKGWKLPVVGRKAKRMKIIAANGILILMPSAFFLASKAQAGAFDTMFYVVQAAEIIAGAINITLLSLNMRDGLALRRRRKSAAK
ncbi:hypothetical protein [Profundibacter amoris]|uniref:Uncharacterized protein n=1 Tax=Profundibacter amoris TaxID=2171755 RepID=A0A347UE70_9RHOB|nr:hypothetical protein [Profundibacter amoris]AXX97148.1 hypothetical protein BAR1_03895 [Profundibacter amoris]